LRNSVTGESLAGNVRVTQAGAKVASNYRVLAGAPAALPLQRGYYSFSVSGQRVRPLATEFQVDPDEPLDVTFWLDPEEIPAYLRDEAVLASIPAGMGLFHGFVHDAETGRAVRNAFVFLDPTGASTTTDANGYFRILYRIEDFGDENVPPSGALIVQRDGYRTHTVYGILMGGGATLYLEDLERGQGETRRDDRHKIGLSEDEQRDCQSAPHPADDEEAGADLDKGLLAASLVGIAPPTTIRVGLSCSGTTCGTVSTMSLETYVRRGLNDEWISSWNGQSLRAGSIAYRSYGAYYVLNPLRTNYDICSTTSCQVNDSDTATSTDQAANATSGFMLQRGGAVFRAEYSSENNAWDNPSDGLSCVNADLSCGNGYAGSPSASWPCVSDSVCVNQGCFGHGRGECQWGTQRWASSQGKYWNWITDHYYNANGAGSGLRTAYITSPITMPSCATSVSSIAAGETFTINFTASNSAEMAHSSILVGASLYSSATGYVSDPAHDARVTVNAGSNSLSRLFTVPAGTGARTYDLHVSLYYDVDGNNVITVTDLQLLQTVKAAAITVVSSAPVERLSDGNFEGGLYGSSETGTSGTTGPWSWTSSGSNNPISFSTTLAYQGSWLAWLNGFGFTETDTLQQSVTIPSTSSSATFSFYLKIASNETTTTTAYDTLTVVLIDGAGASHTLGTWSNLNRSSSYVQRSFNVLAYKGQRVTFKFTGREDGSKSTSFYVDNVSLMCN
jgi:hypothetical protein